MISVTIVPFFLLSTCLLLVGMVDFVASTSIKMDYLPTGHARVDPILKSDCPSDHVHTFYGPQSGVDPRRNDPGDPLELHSRLIATDPSENTGNVEENKSMYWHPTVYKFDKTTETYTLDEISQSSAYYLWETGEATAFPHGFQMIGGFDPELSHANAECVNESLCDDGDCYTKNNFFPSTKCDELEVSMRMPSCWDGININSPPDHTGHVAYPDDFDDCPDSHPVKLPQILLYFRIAPYDGGWHTFSDGSEIFHADYVSGWEEEFLQSVLDECENAGFGDFPNDSCDGFLTYRDGPKCWDPEVCDFSDPQLLEKIKDIQPSPALDVRGTIVEEETTVVVKELPRGTCNGSLVGGNDESGCQDDPAFRFKGKQKKNCKWIKKNSPEKCEKKSVSKSCPVSCDACFDPVCKDNSDFSYKGDIEKDCKWVKKKVKKGSSICNKKSNGTKVNISCPVACGAC